jgi:DnaJ-class molecular chaperone
MSENYYNILGVEESATQGDIKKAYRSLSFKFHPDKNLGDLESTSKFQKINEAYEILGDEQKRQEYDMSRKNPFIRMNSNNGMHPQEEDILNMFFNGGIPGFPPGFPHNFPPGVKIHVFNGGGVQMEFQQAIQKPSPIIKNINITLEQVLTGANIPIEIDRWIHENGSKVFEKETIYIPIPQGVDDGEIIILRDKGNVINANVKGDIKIFIKITNDTLFQRSGLDLIYSKHISLKDALCGFSFEIKFINNKSYTLNNNKGSVISPEYKKIYPSMGLTRGEHTGNMIIHFHIDFPEKLTEEQIKTLSEIL